MISSPPSFMPTEDAPLSGETLGPATPLRVALEKAGYTVAAVEATTSTGGPGAKMDLEMVQRRVRAIDSPYHLLVRLFLLAETLPPAAAALAVAPAELALLHASGLLLREGEGFRAAVRLSPFAGLFFVSDFGQMELRRPLSAKHVLGIGSASRTLSKLAVQQPGGTVFDLGCGSGVQALLAARTAARVVGSDTNPRALNMAAFNAHLNGITNVEWRHGSFYEPVAGEQFQGIVANPPFVISPRSHFLFCDSELSGDGVSEHVMRGAAEHLEEGGIATVLFNWYHTDEGADWEERPFSWSGEKGCDSWLLHSSQVDPLTYAANWLRQVKGEDPAEYARQLDEWVAYYETIGARRFFSGLMLLRKRAGGDNWQRVDTVDFASIKGDISLQVRRVLENETLLRREGEEGLLSRCWQVHHEVALTQHMQWNDEGWNIQHLNFGSLSGLPFAGDCDMALVSLLSGCQGGKTLEELIALLAAEMEVSVGEIRWGALQIFAKLVRSGLVTVSSQMEETEKAIQPDVAVC